MLLSLSLFSIDLCSLQTLEKFVLAVYYRSLPVCCAWRRVRTSSPESPFRFFQTGGNDRSLLVACAMLCASSRSSLGLALVESSTWTLSQSKYEDRPLTYLLHEPTPGVRELCAVGLCMTRRSHENARNSSRSSSSPSCFCYHFSI
jgi:hypothetical protein